MQKLVVLQRQMLRENDWLLDVFTEQRGRLRLVLNRPQTPPDLFTLYQADWKPSDEWPIIKGWEPSQHWPLSGTHLYCGFYLNELLVRLIPVLEGHASLFASYVHALNGLSSHDIPDPWLRIFEWQLLQILGYGFDWTKTHEGQSINPELYYQFIAGRGFVRSQKGYLGADLLAFVAGSQELPLWKMARTILRNAIDHVLQGPLYSRELLMGVSSSKISGV